MSKTVSYKIQIQTVKEILKTKVSSALSISKEAKAKKYSIHMSLQIQGI
jgi:hypothetical protein